MAKDKADTSVFVPAVQSLELLGLRCQENPGTQTRMMGEQGPSSNFVPLSVKRVTSLEGHSERCWFSEKFKAKARLKEHGGGTREMLEIGVV